VKLHSGLTMNGRYYAKGQDISGLAVYPFFLIHMAAFGLTGFLLAYGVGDFSIVFWHGGVAIAIYMIFYLVIFGLDEVKWMFINAGLGIFGIMSQIDWILRWFGRTVSDYPAYMHVIPFLYFVLYTFLIRHALLDVFGAREDDARRRRVDLGYVGGSLLLYAGLHFLEG
jgi:hypothetical protein